MISKEKAENLKEKLGYTNAIGMSSRGRSGGLCLYWNEEDTTFTLSSYSHNHICGDITKSGITWRFAGIYGWPEEGSKQHTWSLIKHLCEEDPGPIILGGYFNELLSYDEKAGGADRERREIEMFRETVDLCGLRDLGYTGQWWTWEKGRNAQTCVRERLDRFLATAAWQSLFPDSQVEHLLRISSDHKPILLQQKTDARRRRKYSRKFRFETAWLFDESCEKTVEESWLASRNSDIFSKLSQLGEDLTRWSKTKFNALGRQISDAAKELKDVQGKDITIANCEQQILLEAKLNDLHTKHEAYWHLRSRVQEVRDGDRNTSYCHQKASQRKKRNYIKGLYDDEGKWQEDEAKVETIVCDFYSSLFSTDNPDTASINEVLQHIPEVVNSANNEALIRPYSKEEVYHALQQMHPSKAPGPNTEGRLITSDMKGGLTQVSELINQQTMEWKTDIIAEYFNERDQKFITAIPLSTRAPRDRITWAFSKTGIYSVKSAYMIGRGRNMENIHQIWVFIWSLDVPPKVRHFLWRVCTDTLPTRSLLKHRHMAEEACCPWCGTAEETTRHALFECCRAKELWEESSCSATMAQGSGDMRGTLQDWAKKDAKMVEKAAVMAWIIWRERNMKVFENKITPNVILVERLNRTVEEMEARRNKTSGCQRKNQTNSAVTWAAPPPGYVKINTDACVGIGGWVGLGVIARGSRGEVLFSAVRRVTVEWQVEVAEAMALVLAAKLARRYGFADIIIETDCQVLVTKITKKALHLTDLDKVLEDAMAISSVLNSVQWSHVKKAGNIAAHHLARLSPFGEEQVWLNHCPTEIESFVNSDKMSLFA